MNNGTDENLATPREPANSMELAPSTIALDADMYRPSPVESDFSQDDRSGVLLLEDLLGIKSPREFVQMLKGKNADTKKISELLRYEDELERLQVELVRMQRWIQRTGRRLAILFEGRDAAGKGGAIRRFTEHLNPRAMRVVALPKPTEEEQGQWYFQRYMKQLPNRGEMVFFDRSWYNRAVVEPVNSFCTPEQYAQFMRQVPEYEHMLFEDGVTLIKLWFSISKEEQLRRFQSRAKNPLKQWKLSPLDDRAKSYGTSTPDTKSGCLAKRIPPSAHGLWSKRTTSARPGWKACATCWPHWITPGKNRPARRCILTRILLPAFTGRR